MRHVDDPWDLVCEIATFGRNPGIMGSSPVMCGGREREGLKMEWL